MKIISPSYEIIEDKLEQLQPANRIEQCGRLCYKSEDKITDDSAIPFVRKMIKSGHNPVLEMATFSWVVNCSLSEWDKFRQLDQQVLKYLQYDYLYPVGSVEEVSHEVIVTASLRSIRDAFKSAPGDSIISACFYSLAMEHKELVLDLMPKNDAGYSTFDPGFVNAKLISKSEIPEDFRAKHEHVAVKFIVNRAVSHEIVRHRPCSLIQESQRYCNYSSGKFGGEVEFVRPMFFKDDQRAMNEWEWSMWGAEKLYLKLLDDHSPQAARTVLPNSCKTELILYANLNEWQHIFNMRTSKAAEPSMREVMVPLHEEFKSRFPGLIS